MSLWKRFTTPNVGTLDRILRALPFALFVHIWTTGALAGVALVAFGVVSAMLLLTAVTGLCSIYAMLGISTRKRAA